MKGTKILLLALGLNLTIANIAVADQCAYITKKQALTAVKELDIGKTIYQFCELCGDQVVKPLVINSLSVNTVENGKYWEIQANNTNLDLAYTYVSRRGAKFKKTNLASIAKCKTSGVSQSIIIK